MWGQKALKSCRLLEMCLFILSCCVWIFPRTLAAAFDMRFTRVSSSLPPLPRLQRWQIGVRIKGKIERRPWFLTMTPAWLLRAANGKRIWDFHFFFRCRHISQFWTSDFPITFLPVIFDILDCFKKGFILHQQTFNKNLHIANNWRGFGAMVRGPRFIYLEELAELVFETTSQEATAGASDRRRHRLEFLLFQWKQKPSVFFLFTWIWTS